MADWLSQAKFWILIFLSIPSSICSILILIYFYRQRRNILIHYHLVFVLITTSLLEITTDISFNINYYQKGRVILGSNIFCTWWNWWEYSLNVILLFVMAWGSIERHLLVFHNQIMATKRKRFVFHFLPMLITSFYPPIFYFIFIVLNSCSNQWNYEIVLCLGPCYLTDQPAVATYDFLGNIVFPIVVIIIANICLILRVLSQKRRHHAAEAWRRQRKLTRQLVLIAILYTIFWFPLAINGLILIFVPSSILQEIPVDYFYFILYMVPILLPFISLSFLSNFIPIVFKGQMRTIAPGTLHA